MSFKSMFSSMRRMFDNAFDLADESNDRVSKILDEAEDLERQLMEIKAPNGETVTLRREETKPDGTRVVTTVTHSDHSWQQRTVESSGLPRIRPLRSRVGDLVVLYGKATKNRFGLRDKEVPLPDGRYRLSRLEGTTVEADLIVLDGIAIKNKLGAFNKPIPLPTGAFRVEKLG